jgi:hypothetical protein
MGCCLGKERWDAACGGVHVQSINEQRQASSVQVHQGRKPSRNAPKGGEYDDYVVPISKTPTSSGSREVLGFVEAYSALGTCSFGPRRGSFMDKSGRMLSYVSMYRTVRGKCSQ